MNNVGLFFIRMLHQCLQREPPVMAPPLLCKAAHEKLWYDICLILHQYELIQIKKNLRNQL